MGNIRLLFRVILGITARHWRVMNADGVLGFVVGPPRLSLEECRRLLPANALSDDEILKLRDQLYTLAEIACGADPRIARAFLADDELQERASIILEGIAR